MRRFRKEGSRLGLTLVEILAVVIILAMIATVVAVSVGGSVGEAKHQIARTQIGVLKRQVETWRLKHHRYPTVGEGLRVLTEPANSAWYVEPAQIRDPWGNQFQYLEPGPGDLPFEIKTYGADGSEGGEGENADISSASLGRDEGP